MRRVLPSWLTGLDARVFGILLLLGSAVLITALRGDNVGVQIVRFAPAQRASPSSVIAIQFGETMDRDSVAERLVTDPPTPGEVTWAGPRMLFHPSSPLTTGTTYTVTLQPGAVSEQGRRLLAEHRFSFDVVGPRVAYLAPADEPVKDVWIRDADGAQAPVRLTNSAKGVVAFDVSPDGGRIAYAERKADGVATDLSILDLDTREVRPLTSCGTFVCTNPVWSPDGTRIAYERLAYSSFEPGISTTSSRVWLLDPDTNPPATRPVIADPNTPPNYKPRWAPDGQSIAVSQLPTAPNKNPGVVVVNLADDTNQFFPTSFASMAAFSPDGARLTFPDFSVQGGEMQTVLEIADRASGRVDPIPAITQAHEALADWQPNGTTLVIARRAGTGDQVTGRQLFSADPNTGATTPLVQDPDYDHSSFRWSPDGRQLLLEKARVWNGGADIERGERSQVWIADPVAGTAHPVATNAFAPRWVP